MNTQSQITSLFQVAKINISQDSQGRYSLNDLHKAAGGEQKYRPQYWLATQQSKELIAELATDNEILKAGIPAFNSIKGRHGGGTYVVKELVYSYAMWISPKFHLQVIRAYDALQSSGNAGQLPYGLKRGRKTASADTLSITPLELDALVDKRVKQVLEGEVILKPDCPKYHAPLSLWQLANTIGRTGWLTIDEYNRVEPGNRPLAKILLALKHDGHDVEGALAEYNAIKLLLESFHYKLDMLKDIFDSFSRRGLNISHR